MKWKGLCIGAGIFCFIGSAYVLFTGTNNVEYALFVMLSLFGIFDIMAAYNVDEPAERKEE